MVDSIKDYLDSEGFICKKLDRKLYMKGKPNSAFINQYCSSCEHNCKFNKKVMYISCIRCKSYTGDPTMCCGNKERKTTECYCEGHYFEPSDLDKKLSELSIINNPKGFIALWNISKFIEEYYIERKKVIQDLSKILIDTDCDMKGSLEPYRPTDGDLLYLIKVYLKGLILKEEKE